MPLTPYHFGPGLLLKAARPSAVSFSAFVVANLVIDAEVLVRYLLDRPPLHATLHTGWAAAAVGLLAGVMVAAVGYLIERDGSEWSVWPALFGGLLGGIGQPLLDSIVHREVQPLAPLSAANPLFGVIGSGVLEGGCALAGLVGGGILVVRWWRSTSGHRR